MDMPPVIAERQIRKGQMLVISATAIFALFGLFFNQILLISAGRFAAAIVVGILVLACLGLYRGVALGRWLVAIFMGGMAFFELIGVVIFFVSFLVGEFPTESAQLMVVRLTYSLVVTAFFAFPAWVFLYSKNAKAFYHFQQLSRLQPRG